MKRTLLKPQIAALSRLLQKAPNTSSSSQLLSHHQKSFISYLVNQNGTLLRRQQIIGHSRAYSTNSPSQKPPSKNNSSDKADKKEDHDHEKESPIDVSEKLIYEPEKNLTPEQHQQLLKSQVDSYFDEITWRDYIFLTYMFIMTIVACLYFFFVSLTKGFSDRYTPYLNRLLDERKELLMDTAGYAWKVAYGLLLGKRDVALEEDQTIDFDEKYTADNKCTWPAFHLTFKGVDLEHDLVQHPELKQILSAVFGTESLHDLRFLNSNFVGKVKHEMDYFPTVKHENSRFNMPYKTYNKSFISFYFPVVNVKTKVKSVLKVTLKTEHDLDRYEKTVQRKVPLTPREEEKERIEQEKQDYIKEHGRLQYLYRSWTGTLVSEHDETAEDMEQDTATNNDTDDSEFSDSLPGATLDDHHHNPFESHLSPEEQAALHQKRLRDKHGLFKYHWRSLRGTLDEHEDDDLFIDDPAWDDYVEEEDEKKKKKAKRLPRHKYYENLPLVVDSVRLCDPKPFMMDFERFFNHVPGYNISEETFISWPFESFDEVPIIENMKKSQETSYLDDYLPSSEEAKPEAIEGHLFLDELPRDSLPTKNENFMQF